MQRYSKDDMKGLQFDIVVVNIMYFIWKVHYSMREELKNIT